MSSFSPESMRLQSPRESERTTAKDPVEQIDDLTRAIWRSIRNINKGGRGDGVRRLSNIWQKVISKEDAGKGRHQFYHFCEPIIDQSAHVHLFHSMNFL